MKWINKKEIKNRDIVIGMILSCIAGFTWAYLHWGLGINWF